jgi:hypothetical protein
MTVPREDRAWAMKGRFESAMKLDEELPWVGDHIDIPQVTLLVVS